MLDSGMGSPGTWGLAGAIATREHVVGLITKRINQRLTVLSRELEERLPEVRRCLDEPGVFRPKDRDSIYELLIDFDSLLFETRSAYELTVKFVSAFLAKVLKQPRLPKGKKLHERIASELSRRQAEVGWIGELKANRDKFIHDTAPWIALDVACLEPFKADIVLLKGNVTTLHDPETWVRMTDLTDAFKGFQASTIAIEAWLSDEIERYSRAQHTPGR